MEDWKVTPVTRDTWRADRARRIPRTLFGSCGASKRTDASRGSVTPTDCTDVLAVVLAGMVTAFLVEVSVPWRAEVREPFAESTKRLFPAQ